MNHRRPEPLSSVGRLLGSRTVMIVWLAGLLVNQKHVAIQADTGLITPCSPRFSV